MTITIELTQGKVTVIDDQFAELVQYKWFAWRRDNTRPYYAKASIPNPGKFQATIYLSRSIMELHLNRKLIRSEYVDHINHDTLDNRLENLAVKTSRGNQLNSKTWNHNSSGYRGVSWYKAAKKWVSNIRVNKILIYLGYFTDIIEAARMYDRAYLYFGGDDAVPYGMNFPQEVETRQQELTENVYKWMR